MTRTVLGLRILLVVALVVSTQGLLLVQSTYLLRQDYVASALCVNRFNPDSDCNGKCYLKEQMARHHGSHQSDDGHEQAPALLEVALSVQALLSQGEEIEMPAPAAAISFLRLEDRRPDRLMVSGVFHPPRIG